jgi:predicted nucleotidyltransferase
MPRRVILTRVDFESSAELSRHADEGRYPRLFSVSSRMEEKMSVSVAADPVLIRFRRVLDEIYRDQIERVVLYGSRARGDAHVESDYDVAIFLHGFHDRWQEMDRLVPVVTDILYEDGAFIHAMPYRAGAYRERTPLMHEIRREGLDL